MSKRNKKTALGPRKDHVVRGLSRNTNDHRIESPPVDTQPLPGGLMGGGGFTLESAAAAAVEAFAREPEFEDPAMVAIDLRVWQNGRAGIYLNPEQRVLLAPFDSIRWKLGIHSYLEFTLRFSPTPSDEKKKGVVRVNHDAFVLSHRVFTKIPEGRHPLVLRLDGDVYRSEQSMLELQGVSHPGAMHFARRSRIPPEAAPAAPIETAAKTRPPAIERLRSLVSGFNEEYDELFPELEEMQPVLTLEGTRTLRAHLTQTI